MSDDDLVMGKVSLHICGICGAAVPFDADLERPQEAERMHYDWHDRLNQRVDAAGSGIGFMFANKERL